MVVNVQRKDKSQNMKVIMNKIYKLNTYHSLSALVLIIRKFYTFRIFAKPDKTKEFFHHYQKTHTEDSSVIKNNLKKLAGFYEKLFISPRGLWVFDNFRKKFISLKRSPFWAYLGTVRFMRIFSVIASQHFQKKRSVHFLNRVRLHRQ